MTAQHPDDILAMRMMETARLERKRAAERDGIHPGGLISAKRPGAKDYRVFSANGKMARELLAAKPGLTAKELAAQSGITVRGARHIIISAAEGPRVAPPTRNPVSPAGQKARDLFAADPTLTPAKLAELSGLSRRGCADIVSARRPLAPVATQQRVEAEKLLMEGRRTAEIAQMTGLHERWLRKLRKRMGLTAPPSEAPPPPPSTISPAGLKARAILAEDPTIGSSRLAQLSGLSRTGARDVIQKAREARRAKVQA